MLGMVALRPGSSMSGAAAERVHALTAELNELKGSVEGLETERDFYFAKASCLLLSCLMWVLARKGKKGVYADSLLVAVCFRRGTNSSGISR